MLIEVNVIETDGESYKALVNPSQLVRALPTLAKSKMVSKDAMSEISLVTGEILYVKETGDELKNLVLQSHMFLRNARLS